MKAQRETYIATEIEPEGKTASVKATSEAPFVRELPFAVDDPESNVFVWRASGEVQ